MDAAERLFARDGYHGTSLRAITGAAGVNLAAVNYHFGSKEALMVAVLERRLVPLNRARSRGVAEAVAAARARGHRPRPREILRAVLVPTLRFMASEPGARHFVALVGRAHADPDPTVRDTFRRLVAPLHRQVFSALSEALPHLPPGVLYWRILFFLGAMNITFHAWTTLPLVPEGVRPPTGADELVEILLDFAAAGMEAPA
nr:TetR family transcriptional regulator [Dissulfurirhabdus thermomarina]